MSVMIPEAAAAASRGAAAGGSRAAAARSSTGRPAGRAGTPPGGTAGRSTALGGPRRKGQGAGPAKKKAAPKQGPAHAKRRSPAGANRGGGGKSPAGKGRSFGLPKDASKLVLAEFVICMVILVLSPLTSKGQKDIDKGGAIDMTLKASALAFVFFILALVSAGGRSASRIAAGFGGIITLGYVVSQGDVFGQIAKLWVPPSTAAAGGALAQGAAGG